MKEIEVCLGCGADQAKRDCGCPAGTGRRLVDDSSLPSSPDASPQPDERLWRLLRSYVVSDERQLYELSYNDIAAIQGLLLAPPLGSDGGEK